MKQNSRRCKSILRPLLALAAALLFAEHASAQTTVFAYDDAGNYQVSANWTNGANRGFGFTPWVMATNVFASGFRGWYLNNGYAIASSTNVNGTNYTNCSWGIYANGTAPSGGNLTVGYRGFAASNALTTHVTFKLQWMSEGVGSAATNLGGFVLRSGNSTNGVADLTTGARFQYCYIGGGANSYLVVDGRGTNAIGIPFGLGSGNASGNHAGATGMNCEFTLEPNDTYRFVVRCATNNAILASVDGQPLAGAPGSAINSVAIFANETVAGGSGGGDQNFNRLQIVSPSLLAPAIVNALPVNGTYFVNPNGTNVSFEVDSAAANLVASNVSLALNGVNQTLVFNTLAGTPKLLATNTTPLVSNTWYTATVSATDGLGGSASYAFSFNTFYPPTLFYDVTNYGAVGDGTTMNTAAIQAAINACAPGGYVWLHDGTFLTGTIYLKDNMTLYIDSSATLLGSGSSSDYPVLNPPTSNSQKVNCDKALVYAESHTNVTIRGGGTINGNGRNNFTSGVENTRPISVWTALCSQVTIRDITVVDSCMWTIVNMESDNLLISNVTVNANLPNTHDGCDVVDCWHVNIVNCSINSGDDSICLKSGVARGVNDCHVRNCTVVQSGSNGLKFGTASSGGFSNITFMDCTVQNTSHSAMAVESVDGGGVSGILFSNITFSGCQNAFFVLLGSRSGAAVGSVNGITFQNITGTAMSDTRGSPIMGEITNSVDYKVKNIVFNNVNVTYKGGVSSVPVTPAEYAGQYPENTDWGNLPAYGYYVRHATGITFTNCHTAASASDARPWLNTSDVTGIVIAGPTLQSTPNGTNIVLTWSNGFILQTATNAGGAWSDLAGATSPYTNTQTGARRFFRLRQ